ncbi:MAG: ribonuclease HII [Acidobacteria bacterium RIFCSPHIGHO2_12_FULL_67_30]|nr:MAG: ribonuclease HII [Acidobacteria bacterium RIFCSPHIGHO2_12_FULL_67_30]
MAGRCTRRYEREAGRLGFLRIAGVDEVGRGALFGPVVAAAVILNPARRIPGLDDSKKLTAARRRLLSEKILERAVAWAVAEVLPERIDAWNIYQASRQAMERALKDLKPPADFILSDAMRLELPIPCRAVIHGDARSVSIAAASILAKVYRDRLLEDWDREFPGYGLARHKGYATREHLARLRQQGPTPLHRRSFAPVRESLAILHAAEQNPLPF